MSSEESIDVLTPDGEPAGRIATKEAVHRLGEWHRAAHVWILTSDRRVVLQRRAESKENHPGMWDVSAAGHVSAGETAVEAAVRETMEELGIAIAPRELRRIGTLPTEWVLNEGTYIDRELVDVFVVVREDLPQTIAFDRGEVAEVMVTSVDALKQRVERRDPSLVDHGAAYQMLFREVESLLSRK